MLFICVEFIHKIRYDFYFGAIHVWLWLPPAQCVKLLMIFTHYIWLVARAQLYSMNILLLCCCFVQFKWTLFVDK